MKVGDAMRRAVDRRLNAVERAFAAIEGTTVERRGDAVIVRGAGLARRFVRDARFRLAGLAQ